MNEVWHSMLQDRPCRPNDFRRNVMEPVFAQTWNRFYGGRWRLPLNPRHPNSPPPPYWGIGFSPPGGGGGGGGGGGRISDMCQLCCEMAVIERSPRAYYWLVLIRCLDKIPSLLLRKPF